MSLRLLHYSDVENAYDDPERIGRLAGLLQSRRDGSTLVFGTGDNTSPGVVPLVARGEQALDFYEAVRPDGETLGNHDFDYGPDRTLELVERSPQPWLCANVDRDGRIFGHSIGIEPWTVLEADGSRVGVFGVTTPKTASFNPNTEDVTFTDPIPAAREAVASLRERDVDHVVCLSHLGRTDERLATAVDVGVVLGGHTHSELVERIDDTLLTRPGVNGRVVYEVLLPDRETRRHEVADGPLDSDVRDALAERKERAGVGEVLAHVHDPIERTETACFRGESRIGNFVADAYRWRADAEVALQNSGGIRSGPALAGDVTLGDLVSVVPFDEPLAVAEVTGAQLRDAFAQGEGSRLDFGEPDWWHAHVSGARVVYDRSARELLEATVNGEPVCDDRTYRLAVSDYVLHTDDEFPALSEADRVELLDTQYEVLAAIARECGVDPRLEGRIRHV
jgi:2',3'-cyclic-nucleotide 2'-phosphodiesterase (5'-nucleotidase family)